MKQLQELTRKRFCEFILMKTCHVKTWFNLLTQHLEVFKRFTPYKVGKLLAETLIISKIRYCLIVYSQLPKCQIHRLQKTQNRVASYVLGQYVKEDDLIKTLCWLPITELVDFSIINCCFSVLHDPNRPKY